MGLLDTIFKPTAEECFRKGEEAFWQGRFADAVAAYEQSVALDPKYASSWFQRGTALLQLGRAAEAVSSYDWATDLIPGHWGLWYNRGNALLRAGLFPEALASYDKGIALAQRTPRSGTTGGQSCAVSAGSRKQSPRTTMRLPSTRATSRPGTTGGKCSSN